jgi:hypothetical protein
LILLPNFPKEENTQFAEGQGFVTCLSAKTLELKVALERQKLGGSFQEVQSSSQSAGGGTVLNVSSGQTSCKSGEVFRVVGTLKIDGAAQPVQTSNAFACP